MQELEPDVRRWIQDCLAGDASAAKDLVELLYPTVLKIVRAHLPRRDTEEDLAQEVFLKVFSRLGRFSGLVPLEHWVARIAVTTCIDRLRAQRRRPELRWADLTEAEAEALERTGQVAPGPSPGEAAAARDLVARLLGTLNPADRLVVQCLDMEQRSVADVQALTGWSTATVKIRAFRARRKLRKILEQLEGRRNEK